MAPTSVPDLLHAAADLYTERHNTYGPNYLRFEGIAAALGTHYTNRDAIKMQLINKLSRYMAAEPHADSLRDIIVYAAMLLHLDEKEKEE